jgi:hypothetical protein
MLYFDPESDRGIDILTIWHSYKLKFPLQALLYKKVIASKKKGGITFAMYVVCSL